MPNESTAASLRQAAAVVELLQLSDSEVVEYRWGARLIGDQLVPESQLAITPPAFERVVQGPVARRKSGLDHEMRSAAMFGVSVVSFFPVGQLARDMEVA